MGRFTIAAPDDSLGALIMANSAQCRGYRFGSFTLDLECGALLAADGEEMPLRPKSFSLLRLLAENAGRLLSQEVIMETLWPDVFVTENNVTQCIHDIRRALGAEGYKMLRTRPRRGYLFTSDVIAVPQTGPLAVDNDRGGPGSDRPGSTVGAQDREQEQRVQEDEEMRAQIPSVAFRHARSRKTAAQAIFHSCNPVAEQDRSEGPRFLVNDTTESFFADLESRW
jgi:DNA-binding winged helix-turn-helix (wHTH) protein